MAKVIPFTEARGRLSELLDELEEQHEHFVITRNGKPSAVVISAEEYEALEETLEVLEDADLLRALQRSETDVEAGRVSTLAEVRRDLGRG
jgi:antitoxin YefM